jgi:predicted lysophospholipase L1 biosynthesis ABC-type transport system permease subunit
MFDRTDREGSVPVAVVSDALARHYWPNGDAVGKRMRVRGQRSTPWLQIVGIVGDVLYDWTDRIAEPVLYVPIAQAPAAEAVFLARVSDDPVLSATTLTREIARVDPLLPAYGVMSLRDAIAESFAGTTQIQAMMNMLAAIALVIAVIGIYGIVAYTVASRTREFGIRIALGATRADVFRLVMRHALLLSIAGISLGLVAATAAGRVTRGLVFGTSSSTAAATLIGTAIVIAATTLFAASLPARRATRTDPMNSLRVE